MRYAKVINGVVGIVIEQNFDPGPEWVDITGKHVGPGFLYDGVNFTEPSYKAENNAAINKQIAALEAGQFRGMREFMLTGDKTGLQSLETKIIALRSKLEK